MPLQLNPELPVDTPITPAVGLRLWKREGIASQAHHPTLSLVVQILGGGLPLWVTPSDAEFIIVRDGPQSRGEGSIPIQRLRPFSAKTRVILLSPSVDAALDGSVGLPRANLHIKARDADLDLIGEALAAVFSGNLLIGLDWVDLLCAAGSSYSNAGIGSAVVAEGICGASMILLLHNAVSSFIKDDFRGSFLLIQLVSQADEAMLTLEKIDAFAKETFSPVNERDCLLTAAMGISRSAVVMIAFKSEIQGRRPAYTWRT